MKIIFTSFITFLAFALLAFASEEKHAAETSEKDREKAAMTALQSFPNTVQIYAKGLVCESCGIGIRKKLQKLKFVDTSKPQKGIVVDVKFQLVSVTLKDDEPADVEAIKKAIKGAGYEPIRLYELKGKKLTSISLEG